MDVPAVTTDLPVQGHGRSHPESPVSCANHGRLGMLRGDPHLARSLQLTVCKVFALPFSTRGLNGSEVVNWFYRGGAAGPPRGPFSSEVSTVPAPPASCRCFQRSREMGSSCLQDTPGLSPLPLLDM